MLIANLIKNHAKQETEDEIHAAQTGNLDRHDVFKIEERLQCRRCLKYSKPGETYCGCGCIFAGHHQQGPGAGRATNPQLIPGINDSALKNPEGQTLC